MPYCPKCRDEFQDWVKVCPDCGVGLVDKQPTLPKSREKTARKNLGSQIGTVTFVFGGGFLYVFFDWNLWQTALGATVLMVFAEGVYFVLVKIGVL